MVLAALVVSFAACSTGRAHQNFKNIMQGQVGRSTNDPDIYRNRYPEFRVATKAFANGNVEEEFNQGVRGQCRVFFEIDKFLERIVGWRYEGDCVILP